MFHTPAHKNTINPGATVPMLPPAEPQSLIREYRVTLHPGLRGDQVTTTFRSIAAALDLARQYVADGKRVSIESDFA